MNEQQQKARSRKIDKYPDCENSIYVLIVMLWQKVRGLGAMASAFPPKVTGCEFEEKIKNRVRLPTNDLS